MAISIRGFTGFWPLGALAWVGGIYFTGESLMKWGASICKSEIKLSFFPQTFSQGVIRSLLWVDWEMVARPWRSGTVCGPVSHPFSTLLKMVEGNYWWCCVVVGRVRFGDVPGPKLRWQQWQGSMPNRSIPLMQATSLTTHAGSISVCLCVHASEFVHACVCLMYRTIYQCADRIMKTQCQTRQLIAGWSKHLATQLSTAKVNHCTCTSNWRHGNNICVVTVVDRNQSMQTFIFYFLELAVSQIQKFQFYITF